MGSSLDITQLLWQIGSDMPMILAWLVCCVILLSKRRVAPRACVVAATVYLTLCLVQIVLLVAFQWLIWELNNGGTTLPRVSYVLVMRILHIFHNVMSAVGIVMLTWCVLMGRKPVPAVDE